MKDTIRICFIGDVVGLAGQAILAKVLPRIRQELRLDVVVVNGENAAPKGMGIAPKQVDFFKNLGIAVITTGNHAWAQREIYPVFQEKRDFLLRPANFPPDCPGKGYTLFPIAGSYVAIINVQGRTFMPQDLDCPFKTTENIVRMVREKTALIFIDIHAEASSEKQAMAYYFDGKVSGIVGTHTHVQTADEQILPAGSAYITDLGFCGALHSALGMTKEPIIQRFLTQMPQQFAVEKSGPYVLHGVWIEVDAITGKACHIERIRIIDAEAASYLPT